MSLKNTCLKLFSLVILISLSSNHVMASQKGKASTNASPKIVNIINFIRECEPRSKEITNDVLYETVYNQVKQLSQYDLPGTFLLQYDALIIPRYQKLLKNEMVRGSEVGAWWEITQPHVEAAGLTWRGRYSWDWHANVGFSTGYSPVEREKLVDVYMEKFKEIFGKYPASVGSWFIDAHTLSYMYDKYGIVASCNCKDQLGTDGYTLWGGYWNQAYYPSKENAYMPAQNKKNQIPVPIFRMLGSDPITQYDNGIGGHIQGVVSLEPVYPESGGDRCWIEWFFDAIFNEPCLAFNYTQAGQENSFTWNAMKKGLNVQIPLLDSLRKKGKIRIETLEESGKWFKGNFRETPSTAVTVTKDFKNNGRKTVWFNSRYYRANLLWDNGTFYFRDIHIFDERYPSDYFKKAGTSTQCIYTTLPIVDGFQWSNSKILAGLYFQHVGSNGKEKNMCFSDPEVKELSKDVLQVSCEAESGEKIHILFYEDHFEITNTSKSKNNSWALQLITAPDAQLPFTSLNKKEIKAELKGFPYQIKCSKGDIYWPNNHNYRFIPQNGTIKVDCSIRK